MIIVQISDTHIALDTPDSDQRIRDFEATIADINSLDRKPDVIVHTGDVVHNGLAQEYARSAEIISKAYAPVYVMAGNKDNRENLRAAFSKDGYLSAETSFIDYAVDDFPVRLVMLDTVLPDSNKGDFCSERSDNLISMLNSELTKPTVVFAHHPPFTVNVGPDPHHFIDRQAAERLRDILGRYSQVRALFCGHVHRGTEGQVRHIPAVVMPSIATTLRWDDFPAHLQNCPIYYIHRFNAAGDFTTEARMVRP